MATLILKEEVALGGVAEMMKEMGLVELEAPSMEGMCRRLWMTSNEKSAVHYVDDSITRVRYFSVRGSKVTSLVKALRRKLPLWTRDELLKHALFLLISGSEQDIARVAMEVAAEMDAYDAASAGVLTTLLNVDERTTRLAGARAFRARPWAIFRDRAAELAGDSDPEIASLGAEMLARIIELHGE